MTPQYPIQFISDNLKGEAILKKWTRISDLKNVFSDEAARGALPQDTIVYNVQVYFPVAEGAEGGLFFGITKIAPGQIGNEYYMTRGHFHAVSNRGELYWGIKGHGKLILMDRNRQTQMVDMQPGSLCYIPGHTAHKVANTGEEELSFGACWPSDAGHDYEAIAQQGFSARLLNINGEPQLISENQMTHVINSY